MIRLYSYYRTTPILQLLLAVVLLGCFSSCITREVMIHAKNPRGQHPINNVEAVDSVWMSTNEELVVFARGVLTNRKSTEAFVVVIPIADSVRKQTWETPPIVTSDSVLTWEECFYPTKRWDHRKNRGLTSAASVSLQLPEGTQPAYRIRSIERLRGDRPVDQSDAYSYLDTNATPVLTWTQNHSTNRRALIRSNPHDRMTFQFTRVSSAGQRVGSEMTLLVPYRRKWQLYAFTPPAVALDIALLPAYIGGCAVILWAWSRPGSIGFGSVSPESPKQPSYTSIR